ncbi:T9SS type A sorting domain-containing protein [Flavobacterium rhizosphaerae]|uniref:T9SS type A sorting domain-containing protein n=1 Tax=Flavobacterium rhizosphaerae TaxID=3163298 RepID=A0ABW8YWJ3_9FLAO
MKKIYSLLAVAALSATAMNAQTNLVENGDFETWTEGQPENFSPYTGTSGSPSINNFVTQENTIVHTAGGSSLRHESQTSTQYIEYDYLIEVTPGHSYTISYWYLDNSDTAKTRIWSSWMQHVGEDYNSLSDDAQILRYDDQTLSYSTNSAEWVNKVITITAPASATHFRYQVRTYREAPGAEGGYIYYDDLSFVDNSVAGTKNNEISGLTMYPNPLNGNVLNIASANNAEKTVAIYDIVGKQVLNTVTTGTVNASALNAGVYIVKITEGGKTATRKLIVK